MDDVAEAVRSWKPEQLQREKDYEEALWRFLSDRFPEEVFRRQFTRANSTADIFVEFTEGCEVAIELKANLTRQADMHRLVGQVYEYLETWKVEVVVVICGKGSSPPLVRTAGRAAKFFDEYHDRKARFVDKT